MYIANEPSRSGTVLALFTSFFLLRGSDSSPAHTAACQRIERSLARVHSTIEGLLAFARAGAIPPPGVRSDVSEVVNSLRGEIEPVAAQANVTLRLDVPRGSSVRRSASVLQSVLDNLLRNALKYLNGSTERRVSLRVIDQESALRFEVVDTGPGMTPELARSAFEPYVRAPGANVPGIGLGLATVKRFVRAHGGHVGVDSREGHGSAFWFDLPKPIDEISKSSVARNDCEVREFDGTRRASPSAPASERDRREAG